MWVSGDLRKEYQLNFTYIPSIRGCEKRRLLQECNIKNSKKIDVKNRASDDSNGKLGIGHGRKK